MYRCCDYELEVSRLLEILLDLMFILYSRKVYTLGRRSHSELRQWFGIGVLVAGMLGISSALIMLRELWQAIRWADEVQIIHSVLSIAIGHNEAGLV